MTSKKDTATAVTYKALSAQDRLAIARDFLRGREEEHFRLSLATPDGYDGNDERLNDIAANIVRVGAEVDALESEVG